MSDVVSFYPPPPTSGSNSFGEFSFGVSAFGDIPIFNWLTTVISQYANSPRLLAVLAAMDAALDQTEDYDDFYDLMWNVSTAEGYGLDVWGRIVGVNRAIEVASGNYFGFVQGTTWDTFGPGGSSPFYTGRALTSSALLTDEAYRYLITAKAAANIWNGSVPALNAILMSLFGPGNPFGSGGDCYVTDGMNMTMTYVFKFQPNPVQLSIINFSNVLPRPVGVAATIVINP